MPPEKRQVRPGRWRPVALFLAVMGPGLITASVDNDAGGITTYSLDQKVRHLGVDRNEAAKVNCVSETVARQMAQGACELFGADVAVATTGYAEPDDNFKVSEPFAWWAVSIRTGDAFALWSERVAFPDYAREEVQGAVAEAAIKGLVAVVQGIREGASDSRATRSSRTDQR